MFRALQNNMQVSLDTAKACISAIAVLYNIKLSYDDNFEYDGKNLFSKNNILIKTQMQIMRISKMRSL